MRSSATCRCRARRIGLIGVIVLFVGTSLTKSDDASLPTNSQAGADQQPEPISDITLPLLGSIPHWNMTSPTLGGRQVWADVSFFRNFRLQQNVLTGHFRLLDPANIRRVWGTRAECEAALKQWKQQKQLAPMSGRVVILVHGLIRSSQSFHDLSADLADRNVTVVGFDYPSTRISLQEGAAYLESVIDSLEGIDRIDIVAHSLGGLLVRTWIKSRAQEGPDPRVHRMVMLGVPNQGARLATLLQDQPMFQLLFGVAGQQLVEGPNGVVVELPVPPFEFAIIAGARGTPDGWNVLIPGDDDGTVSVESTRLEGAADFATFPVLHSFLMSEPIVRSAIIRFLEDGSLQAGQFD